MRAGGSTDRYMAQVKLFLAQLIVITAAIFNGIYFAIYNAAGLETNISNEAFFVVSDIFIYAHLLIAYSGLLIVYVKKDKWAPADSGSVSPQPAVHLSPSMR